MKTQIKYFLPLFVLLSSCQKEVFFEASVINQSEALETRYVTLGTWDEWGKPNYLTTSDTVSPSLKSFISNTLPERADLMASHPELFINTANSDLVITQPSDVYISFVLQGAGVTNTLGFYTYPTTNPPSKTNDLKTITYIFPNAGQGSALQGGDKVKIGSFKRGISIGFVLMQTGWNTATKAIDNKVVHFYSTDILNPETDPSLKKHVVAIKFDLEKKVLFGFEDLERTRGDCDNDFNDVMFYATIM